MSCIIHTLLWWLRLPHVLQRSKRRSQSQEKAEPQFDTQWFCYQESISTAWWEPYHFPKETTHLTCKSQWLQFLKYLWNTQVRRKWVVKAGMFYDANVSLYFSPQQSKDSDGFLRSFLFSQTRKFSLIFSLRIWYVLEIWSG